MEYGNGVNVEVSQDNKILIEIDPSKDYGLSSTGKSMQIASSQGNKDITLPNGDVVKLGVNCFIPVKK